MSASNAPSETPAETNDNMNLGVLFGSIAALIWGAWPVVTAFGIKEANFTPYELVFLRLIVAGPLLLPWAFRGDNSRKSWVQALLLSLLAGGTYSFMSASGFQYASAIHGGVIIPGTLMLVGLIASHIWLKDRLTRNRIMGAIAIVAGLGFLAAGSPAQADGTSSLFGDMIFFCAGIMWATYTLLLRIWPMDPIVVTARVSLISFIGILIIHPFAGNLDFSEVPTGLMVLQVVWQGLLSAVVAIILFNKGVVILGAARAGVVNALVPVITLVLAFLFLGEIPTSMEQVGITLILVGIGVTMFLKQKPKKPNCLPQEA